MAGVTPTPFDDEGADATKVHDFLLDAEQYALKESFSDLDIFGGQVEAAQNAGACLQVWIESVTQFGAASFLDEEKYFVPIPIALVSIGGQKGM